MTNRGMQADERLLGEVDDALLEQWRDRNLGYAADIVAALLRKIARLEARGE